MKKYLHTFVIAVIGLVSCGSAQATCYTVYDANDQVIYRSTNAPVDMTKSVREQINSVTPGGYLLANDASTCYLTGEENFFSKLNAKIKAENQDPERRKVSVIHGQYGEGDAVNAERLKSEIAALAESSDPKNLRCNELIKQMKSHDFDTSRLSFGELIAEKAKYNDERSIYESECLTPEQRQEIRQQRTEAKLNQVLRNQRIQQTQQGTKSITGYKCTPNGLGGLNCR